MCEKSYTSTNAPINTTELTTIINPLKCINCQKLFKRIRDFDRHKNRKTPCLIRDIHPNDKNNPNRCIYCNKILASRDNLRRHLNDYCKIKNGGGDILVGKVKDDEIIKKMQQTIDELSAKVNILENTTTHNNVQNNNSQINNQQNIGTINNFVINHYMKPNVDHIFDNFQFILDNNKHNTPISLILPIWFNKEHPENHSIYLVNKKTKEILVYNDGWTPICIDNVISDINYMVISLSIDAVRELDNTEYWLDIFQKYISQPPMYAEILQKITFGSKLIDKPDLAKHNLIVNNKNRQKIINCTIYIFDSCTIINPGRYRKLRRKWKNNNNDIVDLTNQDYLVRILETEDELIEYKKEDTVYDLSKEELIPV